MVPKPTWHQLAPSIFLDDGHHMPHLQVAGRAGRYGGRFPSGVATACSAEGLEYLAHCLAQPSEPLQRAVLFPSLGQLELLSGLHPQVGLCMAAAARQRSREKVCLMGFSESRVQYSPCARSTHPSSTCPACCAPCR